MAKRILVIGGTGLLGEPVVRHLRKSGFAMRLMVRNVEQAARRFGDGFEIVKGDLADAWHLKVAARNCYGVHINLSGKIEQVGVERIAAVASNHRLQRITYISGTSVAAENVGVPVIRRKFFAEQAIRESGIPYCIFCPTWFMEVLPKYVRSGRAFVFGKQPNPYHLLAADDYARIVAASYGTEAAVNKRFILHGPEGILFYDAVKRYCEVYHPHITKVSSMPHWLVTFIAATKGPKELKVASDFMAAFETIGKLGDPQEANDLFGAPRICLDDWLGRTEGKARRMQAA